MKKLLIIILVLFSAIGFLSYLYFSKLNDDHQVKDGALIAASKNAALVFHYQNDKTFYDIISTQDLLEKLVPQTEIDLWKKIKDIFFKEKKIHAIFNGEPLYLSLIKNAKNELGFVLTTQTAKVNTLQELLNASSELQALKGTEWVKLKYQDSLEFFVSMRKNTIQLASDSSFLVAAQAENPKNNFTGFIKKQNKFGKNVLANLFINFEILESKLQVLFRTKFNGDLSYIKAEEAFAALNYSFSQEKILFTGNLQLNNEKNYFKVFEQLNSSPISLDKVLPNNTANFMLFCYTSYADFNKALHSWQEQNDLLKTRARVIKQFQNNYRLNLEEIFASYADNEFGTFQLNTQEKLGIVELKNGDKFFQLFLDASQDYAENIRIFKSPDLLYSFYGLAFKNFQRPYFTIIDNYLVVANHASTLQVFLNKYKSNQYLALEDHYVDLLNQVSTSANVTYYLDRQNAKRLFSNNLKPSAAKALQNEKTWAYFDGLLLQLNADQNRFSSTLLLNSYKSKPQLKAEELNQLIPDSLEIN